jgi:hypothetical protein
MPIHDIKSTGYFKSTAKVMMFRSKQLSRLRIIENKELQRAIDKYEYLCAELTFLNGTLDIHGSA